MQLTNTTSGPKGIPKGIPFVRGMPGFSERFPDAVQKIQTVAPERRTGVPRNVLAASDRAATADTFKPNYQRETI